MTGRRAAAIATLIVPLAVAWLAVAAPRTKPSWQVALPTQLELAPGVAGVLPVEIVPAAGRTVSRDGPVRVEVTVPDGVTTPRPRLSLADAVDPGAGSPAFAIKLTAATAGRYEVVVDVRLWLCARQTCKPVRSTQTIAVDVRVPSPPVDAAPPLVDAPPAPPPASPPDARTRPRGPRRAR